MDDEPAFRWSGFGFSTIIEEYRAAFRGLPREIWLLAFVLLINRAGSMVLAFLTLYFTTKLGYSVSDAAQLLAIYGIGSIVGSYLGGRLTDVLGSIPVQVWSLGLTAIGFFVTAYASSWLELAGCLLFVSVVSEAMRPANSTAVTQYCKPHQHKQGFALTRLALNLGMTLGPAIGGFLATIDYAYLFWADAGSCAIAAWLLFKLFRNRRPPEIEKHRGSPGQVRKNGTPWRDKRFLLFLGLTFASAIVFFQVLSTYPLYLANMHQFTEFQIGLLLAINTLVVAVFEMILVRRISRFNVLKVIGLGYFVSCIGFGITPFGGSFAFFAFCVVVWTIGEMISMPLATAYVAGRSTASNRGAYMGGYTMCYALAFVVAPLCGLEIYRWNPYAVWHLSSLIGVIVLMIAWIMAQSEPQDFPSESVNP